MRGWLTTGDRLWGEDQENDPNYDPNDPYQDPWASPYQPSYGEDYVPTAVAAPTNPYEEPIPTPPPGEPPPPLPPPLPPPTPPSDGGGGGGGSYGSPSSFNVSSSWPTFQAPQLPSIAPFQAPPAFSFDNYAAPTPFAYDQFSAPTLDQAQNEPGYAFARDEGLRALQNAKAARGTLNTGGTLKDLIGWGNRFAEQNYGNVYNRAANTYDRNRGNAFEGWGANERVRAEAYDRNRSNAFDSYKTNYDVGRDVYDINRGTSLDLFDRAYRSALSEFEPRFSAAQATFGDYYNRDRDKLNSLTNIATAVPA